MSIFLSQIASHDAKLVAIYSAYAELNATGFFFLLNQEITPKPKMKTQLDVLFLFRVFPAQCAYE
jgi:hypothetical protein